MLILTALVAGCPEPHDPDPWDDTVTIFRDPSYDFNAITTFWVYDVEEVVEDAIPDNYAQFNRAVLRSALTDQLLGEGYLLAESDEQADLLVASSYCREEVNGEIIYGVNYWGHYWGYTYEYDWVDVDYDLGTLVIDFVDRGTSALVLRGTINGVVSQEGEDAEDRINFDIAKLFDFWPDE
jgi:hypothetical protein